MKNKDETQRIYLKYGRHPEIRAVTTQGGTLATEKITDRIHEYARKYWPAAGHVMTDFLDTLKGKISYLKSGITVNWTDEGGVSNETAAEMGGANFYLHKFKAIIKVSEEVVLDSYFDIEEFLAREFGYGLGKILEKMYINGQGTDGPTGFLKNCKKVQATGAAATYNNIKAVFDNIDTDYLSNSVWLVNKDFFSDLAEAADNNGKPIIKLSDNSDYDNIGGFILGRPCYITLMPEDMPIALGDFTNYNAVSKMPVIQRLNEKYANKGIIGYVMSNYIDGKLLIADSVVALEV